jgi:orotate phosphoribosyltransferase
MVSAGKVIHPFRTPLMQPYQTRFLELALARRALRFGEFTLKSGRQSPYFFNAGHFDSGLAMAELARCYVDRLDDSGLAFDMLFGPAYKGIPLATSVATELASRGRDVPLAFNRKEAKQHGEGGRLIGAPLAGSVLIIDDVVTAGTAVRESIAMITDAGAQVAGVLVALDREERVDDSGRSATTSITVNSGIPVIAIAKLNELLAYTSKSPELADQYARLTAYRQRYGADEPRG